MFEILKAGHLHISHNIVPRIEPVEEDPVSLRHLAFFVIVASDDNRCSAIWLHSLECIHGNGELKFIDHVIINDLGGLQLPERRICQDHIKLVMFVTL